LLADLFFLIGLGVVPFAVAGKYGGDAFRMAKLAVAAARRLWRETSAAKVRDQLSDFARPR